ncbi:MAG: phytanoyl-CoA dioxygenase family protein [Kangiellaceae bacterium]|jgi:ectoine hydroxylase-related dioxygenase (phytanoyl-CoA dioxygenase family)|nr:phytanoyl-CoA dioxygenase family protein [Kangiellaceae bacterium]|tara:strand:- start:7850 stop:8683 length:834 start_codon:yes stop_codon:yes gene_type:complete
MNSERYYGLEAKELPSGRASELIESISLKGFAVLSGVIDSDSLQFYREAIDAVYLQQRGNFEDGYLDTINDSDVCRAPCLYDASFLELAGNQSILAIVRALLGNEFILHLQNAIINRPTRDHQQRSWHRDLPHQNYTTSKPLAINALYVIDEFSEKTGATEVIPHSHKFDSLPSSAYVAENSLKVAAAPGSVILFDSMMIHRAGLNCSRTPRRAINHVYSIPILKQQYDFPCALRENQDIGGEMRKLLGFSYAVPLDDVQWRLGRKVLNGENGHGSE